MMMPANFSAISENEMTYVNGGASLADILAPELKIENWQKFNQNMVTINAGYNAGFGKHENETAGDKFLNGGNGVLNAGLRMVGSAAAIYNLATGTVKNTVNENVLKFDVLA